MRTRFPNRPPTEWGGGEERERERENIIKSVCFLLLFPNIWYKDIWALYYHCTIDLFLPN